MKKDALEQKRAELIALVDNFYLASEVVVKKAREFEALANKVYGVKDGAFWMQRANRLEKLLNEVSVFCPAGYKSEIAKALRMEE
jgi:hypothetical protein